MQTKHIFFAPIRVGLFLAVIWTAFLVQIILGILGIDIIQWGVVPRTVSGLTGIVTMPFLHGGLAHIIGNSVGLVIALLPLYLAFKDEAHVPEVILKIALISGVLVWVFGRQNSVQIGASALVYGLTVYIMVAGFVYRHPFLIACAAFNVFWMGGSFIAGMLPSVHSHISWEGHICGAAAGLIVGLRKIGQ